MHLSFSQLSTYARCPKEYEFAFVKKLDRLLSAGESFGVSVHATLKKWGELEMKNEALKIADDQLFLFSQESSAPRAELTVENLLTLWHQTFTVEGYPSKTDADTARKRGEKLMQHFFLWWSATHHAVLAVERRFRFEVHSGQTTFGLTGRFDRVEKDEDCVRVIDFKTGKVRDQESADQDLQLSLYALAAEETFRLPCSSLSFLFLHEEGFEERVTRRSKEDLAHAKEIIQESGVGILQKNFMPLPTPQKCGRCPFRNVCPAAL